MDYITKLIPLTDDVYHQPPRPKSWTPQKRKPAAPEKQEHDKDRRFRQFAAAIDALPERDDIPGFLMHAIHPIMEDLDSETRRQCCDDMEANFFDYYGNRTGAFFNGFAREQKPVETGEELGKRIMEKRNPHYKKGDETK